tara:strand:- start:37 stop:657 length:621 start_codon:yes stop_codon:yes gene_type:complete
MKKLDKTKVKPKGVKSSMGQDPMTTKHIVDTLNKYEDGPEILDPMATWVKNNNANNANPGTFKKLVEEDEKAYKEMQLKLPKETKDKYGYTPSQNRQIIAQLTRNKDISKRTPPVKPSPVAREQSPFIKHRQKLGEVLRNQKDKKVVLLNKPKPFKINFNLNTYDQPALDADVKLKKEKLDRLRKEKEDVDPDLFKGLGIFFGRKF